LYRGDSGGIGRPSKERIVLEIINKEGERLLEENFIFNQKCFSGSGISKCTSTVKL
jgi:hypothetical protein